MTEKVREDELIWYSAPGDILFEVESPGFSTRYPTIFNIESIPKGAFSAMDRVWSNSNVAPETARGYLLRNVWVAGNGIIFDEALRAFEPTIWPSNSSDVEQARSSIQSFQISERVCSYDNRVVLCRKPGNGNYGHWLLEMLPKALIARSFTDVNLRAIVQNAGAPLAQAMERSLVLSQWDMRNVVKNGSNPYFYKELIAVVGLTRHGSYMSPLVVGEIQNISRQVNLSGLGAKLYARRSSSSTRRITNGDALQSMLERQGFITCEPAVMSVDEQVAAFRSAEIVVGVMGAELTNIVFCKPNTKIVVLAPQLMPDTFFWFIAQHCNLRYIEVRCPVTGSLSDKTWRLPLTAPLDQLTSALLSP